MIGDIAERINNLAKSYKIGQLQEIRKKLKGLDRRPGSSIFSNMTVSDESEWAFHHGGRRELQFNIGFEKEGLRYGVALSLEPSRTLPDISLLYPNARRLNQFIRQYPDFFSAYYMWHWVEEERSEIGPVTQINEGLLRPHTFIFIGKVQSRDSIDYRSILTTFDELIKPYVFVEKTDQSEIIEDEIDSNDQFLFEPKKAKRAQKAKYTLEQRSVNLSIRHSIIQEKLSNQLIAVHGRDKVSVEQKVCGKKIDIALKVDGSYHFYEIKTNDSAKACIRDALGQLMEYSHWPGRTLAEKLIVVGEKKIDDKTMKYIAYLKERYHIPIEYEKVEIEE